MKDRKSTVAHNCHDNNKKNLLKSTVKKENLTKKKLPYKQDLFAHAKKDLLTYIKKNTANTHAILSRQVPTANSCGK